MRSRLRCRRASSSRVLRLREGRGLPRRKEARECASRANESMLDCVRIFRETIRVHRGASAPVSEAHPTPVASNKLVWREKIGPFPSQQLLALQVQGPLRPLFSVVPKIGSCRDVETRSQAACDSLCILIWRGQSRAVVGGARRRRTNMPTECPGGSVQCRLGLPTTSSVEAAVCGRRRARVPRWGVKLMRARKCAAA